MSLTLNLLTFSKRENSTKAPSAAQISAGRELSVLLKDATSVYNPTFVLRTSDPHTFNYAYCPDFGKYYFVRDWVSDHDMWNCICEEDVLATFRSQIRSSSQYVLRAASAYDEYIIDTAYPCDVVINERVSYPDQSPSTPNNYYDPNPCLLGSSSLYCIGVLGYGTTPVGAVNYYIVSKETLTALIGFMMSDVEDWSDITELEPGVQKALLNPLQYIVSCVMLPLTASEIRHLNVTPVTNIYFGHYSYEVASGNTCYAVRHNLYDANSIQFKMGYIRVPVHPQASSRGKYLNASPYSDYILHFDPVGDIPFNGNDSTLITADTLDDNRYVTYFIFIDLTSGMGQLTLFPGKKNVPSIPEHDNPSIISDTSDRLAVVTFQCGIPIKLAQAFSDPIALQKAQGNVIGAAFSAAASGSVGSIGGAIASVNSGIADAIAATYPHVNQMGSNGTLLQGANNMNGIYIKTTHKRIVPGDNNHLGRPLCQIKQLSTLSGYVLCSNADLNASTTKEEDSSIVNYLNTGVFLE